MAGGLNLVVDVEIALLELGMSIRDLWIGYFSVGGNGSLADVQSWLGGGSDPPDRDYDLLPRPSTTSSRVGTSTTRSPIAATADR